MAPKPDTSKEWQVRQRVIAKMRNEVDIFGLVESGLEDIVSKDGGNASSETSDEEDVV